MHAASWIARLRERNEAKFVAVLPRADRGLAVAWWTLLVLRGLLPAGFAMAMGALVGAVQRGEALAAPLGLVGVVFVLLQVLSPDPPGGRRESRQPHRRLALRPADRGVRAAAGDGPPRGSDAHQRPHDGPRLRPRHHRAAALHLDGLHRERAGRDGGRPGLGGGARRLRVVGAAPAGAAPGSRRTGCCARAASGATGRREEVREAQRHADYAYRLAVDPPAAKELRLFGLAGWVVERFRSAARASLRAPLAGDAPARASGGLEPAAGARRQRRRVLVARRRRGRRQPRPRPAGDLRERRGRHEHDRLRRTLLGARRRGRAGRRGAAPRGGHGARGRAGAGRGAGRRDAGARDPFSRTSVRLPRHRRAGARGLRPDDSRRLLARHRRPERRRQDHAREAALPALRPAGRRHRGRRRRPARARPRRLAVARRGRVPGLHPLRAAAARQRGSRAAPPTRSFAPRSPRPAPPTSAGPRTSCSRAATPAARTSPAASGSASRWRGRSAPCGSAPAWCCSTSRPRSSTCAARPRSSTASSPPRAT